MTVAWRNEEAYVLALEVGDYRAALTECIRALRRPGADREWTWRFAGAWVRRHRGRC